MDSIMKKKIYLYGEYTLQKLMDILINEICMQHIRR